MGGCASYHYVVCGLRPREHFTHTLWFQCGYAQLLDHHIVVSVWVHTTTGPSHCGFSVGTHNYWTGQHGVVLVWVRTTTGPSQCGFSVGTHNYWYQQYIYVTATCMHSLRVGVVGEVWSKPSRRLPVITLHTASMSASLANICNRHKAKTYIFFLMIFFFFTILQVINVKHYRGGTDSRTNQCTNQKQFFLLSLLPNYNGPL